MQAVIEHQHLVVEELFLAGGVVVGIGQLVNLALNHLPDQVPLVEYLLHVREHPGVLATYGNHVKLVDLGVPGCELCLPDFLDGLVSVLMIVPVDARSDLSIDILVLVEDGVNMLLLYSVAVATRCRYVDEVAAFVVHHVMVRD